MYTLREYGLIGWKWLLSFRKSNWQLNDYPVRVRPNGANPEPQWAWAAQILNWPGPSGLGRTHQEAIESLREVLENIRRRRAKMPRPGTKVPIEFASSTRVDSNPELRNRFIEEVLGFDPNAVFISDETTLDHFGDQKHVAELQQRILNIFGVDVSDLKAGFAYEIFERIQGSSRH